VPESLARQGGQDGIHQDEGSSEQRPDGGAVVKGKEKSVHDGPFAEAKDVVGGYVVVEAKDLAHAVELSKSCPILEAGGSVEVRPIQKLNM